MKKLLIMLLSMGSLAAPATAQTIAGVIKCQRPCCNPAMRKKVVKKPVTGGIEQVNSGVTYTLPKMPKTPTAQSGQGGGWANFRGENPVIISGTTGNVNVSVYFGDTTKSDRTFVPASGGRGTYVTESDLDRKIRSILEESKAEQAVKQPYIERTTAYVDLLRKCAGFPLSSTRFKYEDYSREDNKKKRNKRLIKKTSLVPPAVVESDYLFASSSSPFSKSIANVFNTDAGVIVITWVNKKTEDNPDGHWVADFKQNKQVVDDMTKKVRIFWQERG